MNTQFLASNSVPLHYVRGILGLVALVAAFVGIGTVGPLALLLLPVAAIAWRGCPTCWALGLMETRRLSCPDGSCAGKR